MTPGAPPGHCVTVSGADAGLCDGSTYTWSLIVPATSMMTPGPDDAAALETVAQGAAGFSQELFTSFPDADTYLITAVATVSVKLCDALGSVPLVAVIMSGYVPALPSTGIPEIVAVPFPLPTTVTPAGSAPVSVRAAGG